MADKKNTQNNQAVEEQLTNEDLAAISEKIEALEAQVQAAKEGELRARADYNNLQRRSQEERSKMVQMATRSLVEDMLEPLEHLSMTADQLQNDILNVVLAKLWQTLEDHGLKELAVLGKTFDIETMEVVDLVDGATETDGIVVKVVKRGYTLNGVVLQHAKVVVGKK